MDATDMAIVGFLAFLGIMMLGPRRRVTLQALVFALLFGNGCTQAFVEVRHDRHSTDLKPDTILSVGARWYFWDAYGQWLADRVRESK